MKVYLPLILAGTLLVTGCAGYVVSDSGYYDGGYGYWGGPSFFFGGGGGGHGHHHHR
jgi:hypothetical protein